MNMFLKLRGANVGFGLIALVALVNVSIWGGIVWTAVHFIRKFW